MTTPPRTQVLVRIGPAHEAASRSSRGWSPLPSNSTDSTLPAAGELPTRDQVPDADAIRPQLAGASSRRQSDHERVLLARLLVAVEVNSVGAEATLCRS